MRFPADQNRIAEEVPGEERTEAFRRATNCRIGFPAKVTVQYPRAEAMFFIFLRWVDEMESSCKVAVQV